MYLDFMDTRDEEGNPFSPDNFVDCCADDKDLVSLEYSLGQEGPLTAIWDDEWAPPEIPSEYYTYLMIDWYFGTLGKKLNEIDHRNILINANSYLETFGSFDSNQRMEARVKGLQAYLAPMVYQKDTGLARKAQVAQRFTDIDDVIYKTRFFPPPKRRTRLHHTKSPRQLVIPSANTLSDDEDPTSGRSGSAESGGE